jgi:twitching motility protein PilT
MSDQDKTKTQIGVGEIQIQQLFKVMCDNDASDLHLTVGTSPAIRISGSITRVKVGTLTKECTKRLVYQILSDSQIAEFEKNLDLDFSFGIKGLARFRGNVFYSKGGVAAVFRQIPSEIPDFHALGMPKKLLDICDVSSGLVLVTGPTGSGKSTTLAAMIDQINQRDPGHILTLEDPVEFVHKHKNSLVNQREIGTDTKSFHNGLRALLRQDPDIVLVGELRDMETIEAALEVSETGHLVFGTLHTNSAIATISRIVNVFPSDKQDAVRVLLASVLQGIVAQQLCAKIPKGRVVAQEILVPTPAIRNLIREDKLHQLYSQMQIGQDKTGMMTMNQSLKRSLDSGLITKETAMLKSNNPEEMAKWLGIKTD